MEIIRIWNSIKFSIEKVKKRHEFFSQCFFFFIGFFFCWILSFDFPSKNLEISAASIENDTELKSYNSVFTNVQIGKKNPSHVFLRMNEGANMFVYACACHFPLWIVYGKLEKHIPIVSSVIVVCSVISYWIQSYWVLRDDQTWTSILLNHSYKSHRRRIKKQRQKKKKNHK